MDDETQTTGVQDVPNVDATTEDTTTSQASEADVQVTNEAPEATQEQKETTPDLNAKDTVEERLYAGKYKTADDMEKAYTELQSKATKDSQEKAELSRILNETFTEPVTPEPRAQAEDTQYYDNDEPDPVTLKLQTMERKDAVRDFVFLHPDADGKSVNEILQSDPMMAKIDGYEAKLEYAFLKSQSVAAPVAAAEAQKKAQADTQVKIAEKQAAQVEGARQQNQPDNNNQELTPSQVREALKGDKSFDDLIKDKFPGISKMRTRT